ncbi:MAG: low molecular weight phosphotyrosine protein phosphatase [Stenotrophomonas nitritireducens]|uniref:protein-tyrosine-phosphatase n=1 Tax=Stenotrophomonas nitritireducens TaxID=83617 RepID=A0A9D8L1J9_9GAMM|nr:low molecular weight protein-tyrosine-phosphatase [Stenotrophomonas nitritireducens]MBN8790643.1 low molecular weight phosphotyrosine protein phosphatase [Stenotrophomonas nitritireducens]MBN8797592.1 low molecular weight phosphotyrosine protein phosphatase [Stenotrophomonas nitritireducens]MBN8798395.1 low molecular weight phosphotyrosine protein phosphatase [Stenotrophomonas nitritireducens]
MKLLVVCLGNICRSPMGEGALRARIERSPLAGRIEVDSAGTAGWHRGKPPDPRAVACARRHGVDISGLRARQLQPADFLHFDHILCADPYNLDDALALAPPEARARAALLLPWAGITAASVVPDPYYGDDTDFEHSWTLLEAAAEAAVQRLSARPDSGIIGP